MKSKIDKAIHLEKCRRAGWDSYPNSRINYPGTDDPEGELAWLEGWSQAKREFPDPYNKGAAKPIG